MRNLLIFVSLLMLSILSIGIMPVEAKAPALNVSALDTEALDAYINAQMSKHGIRGLLVFVLGLSIFQVRGLLSLHSWTERARTWSTGKKIWDMALSFLIPTVILIAVFGGIKDFFGYRFNLTYQLINMTRMLTDITILMVIGAAPDYIQGLIKLYWLGCGKTSRQKHDLPWQIQS